MVSIDQINAFLSVYECQGYSVAAKKLGKGRTTVRELVITLEEKLDLPLFEIAGRKVKATVNADKLYPHARLLQTQLMSFSGLTQSLHEGEESNITIHYDAALPHAFMVDMTAKLHQKFPYIQISWLKSDWQSAIDLVVKSVSNIAFLTSEKEARIDPGIETYFLGWNNFGVYTGTNSSLQALKSVNKVEFRNSAQIIPKTMLEERINGYPRFANNYIVVNGSDEACRLLTQFGWAILPHNDVIEHLARGDIKQIIPDFMLNEIKISMVAYYRPEINRGPAMTYLLAILPQLTQDYFS